jgi:DHA2 family multidrug resistance protein
MNTLAQAQTAAWKPRANPWLIAVVVTIAAFMEILDTTIVNVALPHIAGSLSISSDDATWALTSYLVANGIVLTISGWLGTVFGRKRYFLVCIAMFTVCSLLCGLAQSLPQLIVFRLLQGFFGGGLQPNQQAILLDSFEPEKRAAAFAITAIATIVAPVLGPVLGGYHRSCLVALDLLHQHPGGRPRLLCGERARGGSTLGGQEEPIGRLHRLVVDHARPGLSADHDGPGPR